LFEVATGQIAIPASSPIENRGDPQSGGGGGKKLPLPSGLGIPLPALE
jgi:hypothetical protein